MPDDCSETWRPVPGFEGLYEVSDRGRLRRPARLLSTPPDAAGYRRASLWKKNRGHSYLVHALVLLAFRGTRPADHDIDHVNGLKGDNRLSNLEYVSRSENILRSVPGRRATQVRGERSSFAKLTAAQVREMRRLAATGVGYRELARRFGVAYPTARNIVLRERWAHVE